MGQWFGTDGVRGVANVDLTAELALAIGRSLVVTLREEGEPRPSVLIGRDPRWSGELLESALVAGICSAGGDAVLAGVVPTPGLAHLTASGTVAAGVMISASHNPVGDNGLKIFGPDGFKLTDAEENRLEELLDQRPDPPPQGTAVGRCIRDQAAVTRYVQRLTSLASVDLDGLEVVVDAANGAASDVAPHVYRELGARVVELNCSPDGANINDRSGSTHPEVVTAAVVEHGADAGVAHDGDADRLIAATHAGGEVDGDVTLAVLARHRLLDGTLRSGAVATTVMTNLGFKLAMRDLGIEVVETRVGDRYVLEAMRERDLVLGGEQSGHVIVLDQATTGDGILTAVSLLGVVRSTGVSLAELATVMTRLPQVLVNVSVTDKGALEHADAIWQIVDDERDRLGDSGRVLVRPSGTEPLVRVMVEAPVEGEARQSAQRIARTVENALA